MMRAMHRPDLPWNACRVTSAHHLVLFVGLGLRPGPDLGEGLARSGIRGLWLERMDQALGAAAHARFDAAVVRLDQPVAAAARQFDAWRRALGCPLLLLADIEDEVDEIIALELGADGLLAQPVSSRRLRAHLLMLLRRGPADEAAPDRIAPPAPVQAGGWVLDRVHNRLCQDPPGADTALARRVGLTDMQAALLQVLMDDLGRVVPRSRLLAAVSRRRTLQPRSVDVYVARLRQRLLDEQVHDLQLDGVRGRGYVLSAVPPRSPLWPGAGTAALDWVAPAADLRSAAPAVG